MTNTLANPSNFLHVKASPQGGNRVILGLMTCGPDEAVGARITELNVFNDVLDVFQKKGYSELDTARVYLRGHQEAFVRSAEWKKKGFSLATKVKYPNAAGDNARKEVFESVETSLRELGTDHVDILYLHAADRSTPFSETLEALDDLYKQGRFTHLGLSNFAAYEVAEIVTLCNLKGWIRPTIYQALYNVLARGIEPELVPACRRYGLDIVVYNPLVGGLLSGKIRSKTEVPASGRFSGPPGTLGALYRSRYFKDSAFEALDLIEDRLAASKEKNSGEEVFSLVEIALRWLVHHSVLKFHSSGDMGQGCNDGIIIGVSSVEQLQKNLDFFEKGPLPDWLVDTLDEAWAITKKDMATYWHGSLEY